MEKELKKLDKFVLDYSNWRSGGSLSNEDSIVGKGETKLLNKEGYMCCLGQFCLQKGLAENDIFDIFKPSELEWKISQLTTYDNIGENVCTQFSKKAIEINDNEYITPEERIEKLTQLMALEGIEMTVINKPN